MLGYIHIAFAQTPINCLQNIQSTWPRDGILRVEIVKNASHNYNILKSYEKEYEHVDLSNLEFGDFILEETDEKGRASDSEVDTIGEAYSIFGDQFGVTSAGE